nr:uncharacterized protein LOC104096754 isoform X3 [Nicotiana tomentosiformis]
MHKDFRRKENIAECEIVGLVALVVEDEEGEGEGKEKKNKNKEENTPDWSQVLTLKKTTEEKITKEGVIGIGAVGVLLGVAFASAFFCED